MSTTEEQSGVHARDEDAEKAVLGILLGDRKDLATEVRRRLQVEDFYFPHHQIIYQACLDLEEGGNPIEPAAVVSTLAQKDLLKRVPSGPIYLSELYSNAPAGTGVQFYAESVKKASTLRAVSMLGVKAQQLAKTEGEQSPVAIIESLRTELDALSLDRIDSDVPSFQEVVKGSLAEIEFLQSHGAVKGISTGFGELDKILSGLHPGQMIIVAARPGIGKALALDTLISTPNGFVPMRDIEENDFVYDLSYKPTLVLHTSEVMVDRPCYNIVFSDETNIVADEQHVWLTQTNLDHHPTLRSTGEIAGDYPEGYPVVHHSIVWDDEWGEAKKVDIISVSPVESVPVKCIQVESPDGMFLAGEGEIPTHNSALALDIARNAAVRQEKSVLVFSLEMSRSELGIRALSAEAFVDAKRLRIQGSLDESDWEKITHASTRMFNKKLGIDDDATVTMADIRAKSRMWKRLHGLDLVVIDYLQLLTPTIRSTSRQQEVSEISRSVKLLAKELNVPVIALSQLNRGPEQRQDKKPAISDLRESGCLTGATKVLRADTGTEVTMTELVESGERDIPVWTFSEGGKCVSSIMSHAFPTGYREVFRINMNSGKVLNATENHPLLTTDGWKPVEEIKIGSSVAVPRNIPEPTSLVESDTDDVIIVAHLIGSGSMMNSENIVYSSMDEENLYLISECIQRRFRIEANVETHPSGSVSTIRFKYPESHRGDKHNVPKEQAKSWGLFGASSSQKFVPSFVFSSPNEKVALFLKHLWSAGGNIRIREEHLMDAPGDIHYSTTSRRLADEMTLLFLRLGIMSRITVERRSDYRSSFYVRVEGLKDQKLFLEKIGTMGRQKPVAEKLLQLVEQILGSEDYEDTIIVDEDIAWDRIVSIESIGFEDVYDATVPENHNFIANGVIVHNSLEQDADVVLLLHREDAYDRESPRAGEADVLIAKQRAGPTGQVTLSWLGKYCRFDNRSF